MWVDTNTRASFRTCKMRVTAGQRASTLASSLVDTPFVLLTRAYVRARRGRLCRSASVNRLRVRAVLEAGTRHLGATVGDRRLAGGFAPPATSSPRDSVGRSRCASFARKREPPPASPVAPFPGCSVTNPASIASTRHGCHAPEAPSRYPETGGLSPPRLASRPLPPHAFGVLAPLAYGERRFRASGSGSAG